MYSIFEQGMATCFAYGQTGSGKTHVSIILKDTLGVHVKKVQGRAEAALIECTPDKNLWYQLRPKNCLVKTLLDIQQFTGYFHNYLLNIFKCLLLAERCFTGRAYIGEF